MGDVCLGRVKHEAAPGLVSVIDKWGATLRSPYDNVIIGFSTVQT